VSFAAEVENFISNQILPGSGIDSVTPEDDLLEVVDSLGIVELVAFLEQTYRIKIDDDDLDPENFRSVARIVALIEKKGG
jgi:acyl carrier protein